MSRSVGCVLASVLVLGVLGGCDKLGNQDVPRGDAAPPRLDAAADAARLPDAMAAPRTCREIRVCVYACGTDASCVGRCASLAPVAARQQYEEAVMCSKQACPDQDPDCRCEQECHGGGTCTVVVDECDEAVSDPFCDGPCH